MPTHVPNVRPKPDQEMVDIADYVTTYKIKSTKAYDTARRCLMDTLGCGIEALSYPACTSLLGPVVPGTIVPNGAKVPGTSYQLDPVTAAFNISCMSRWLDFNDSFAGAGGGHPSDNVGGILAVADWLSRTYLSQGKKPLIVRDVLTAMIKAHEIQGVIGLENSFEHVGLDQVAPLKVAVTATVTRLLGGTHEDVVNAVSNAWVDGHPLRVYRQGGNTGSRKSWAAADAVSRGVKFALMACKGEMGYPSALSAKRWGFYDVLYKGKPFKFKRHYGSYVMENVRFKVFPAEFNAQTAVECAVILHPKVRDRLADIKTIVITTHERALRVIDKRGPLNNPADRDHCIQYMTAVGLIHGGLTAADYEDDVAADPRIDALREKMVCVEDRKFSRDKLDVKKGSNTNAVQVFFSDGSKTDNVLIEYPLGHPRRHKEGLPLLEGKFKTNLARRFTSRQQGALLDLCKNQRQLEAMPVSEFVDLFVV